MASDWAAQVAHGQMTEARHAELQAWLDADRRNRGALLRAQAALYTLEFAVKRRPVLVSVNDGNYRDGRKPTRKLQRFALAACIVALVAASLFSFVPYKHRDGAMQVMALADGSVATLGEYAKIDVDMSGDTRRITLVRGEATFKVFHDKVHPFIVRSGEVFAQATGTQYSVSRVGESGGQVKVSEGSVLVWAGDERDQAVLLRAGGKLTLDPGMRDHGTLPPPEVAQISLDNETVNAAVARFNRVNQMRIEVADARIGNSRVAGQFRADNPEQFARAAAAIAHARIEQKDGVIVIVPAKE